MPRNLSTRQLLKPSLIESVCQKSVALLIRPCNLRTVNILSISQLFTLFVVFYAVSANGISVALKNTKTMDTRFDNLMMSRAQSKVLNSPCRRCAISRLMASKIGVRKINDVLTRPSEDQNTYPDIAKTLRHFCRGLSYSKCRLLYERNNNLKRRFEKLSIKNKELNENTALSRRRDVDEQVSVTSYNAPDMQPAAERLLSRSKRLAKNDRRLVHMYCKTGFTLEIKKNGRVVGNRDRPSSALLEIQSVMRGGVVRFYSRSTGYYLAMDRAGRLFGTKHYSDEKCAFVERLQENLYSTYSAYLLPRKKHRRPRSTRKPWYIGIGRSGRPRKGSKVMPTNRAALFLPM